MKKEEQPIQLHHQRPHIAIVDSNTLATLGLKQILLQVMPIVTIHTYGTFSDFESNAPERYVHYFVAMDIVLSNRSFFLAHNRKTIVLTLSLHNESQLAGFHSLCINQPEDQLLRSLLIMVQHAHGDGRHLPPMPQVLRKKLLTDREIEVMSLIVQGLINKEIAERLHVALATVVTHRKNIMEKLGMKSVSALTIYAVMHGYVDINKI